MARVTVEDCVDKVPNRFELVLMSAHRARELSSGASALLERDNDKNAVVALREIAEEKLKPPAVREAIVVSLQTRANMDEGEGTEGFGAPPRRLMPRRAQTPRPVAPAEEQADAASASNEGTTGEANRNEDSTAPSESPSKEGTPAPAAKEGEAISNENESGGTPPLAPAAGDSTPPPASATSEEEILEALQKMSSESSQALRAGRPGRPSGRGTDGRGDGE